MANVKKYKQYIFKDGNYREVVGSHTVSGGTEPVENGDIEIRLDFECDDKYSFEVSESLYTEIEDQPSLSHNPNHIYLKITSTPITSEFEEAIKNGTGVIRFDYPINSGKNHDMHEPGHKGFARNLYCRDVFDRAIKKSRRESLYKKAILFLTEDDITLDKNGNKIIIKKISMSELTKRMLFFVSSQSMRFFEDIDDGDMPLYYIEYGYNSFLPGRLKPNSVGTKNGFQISEFAPPAEGEVIFTVASDIQCLPCSQKKGNYKNKVFFPMFIIDNNSEFDYKIFTNRAEFGSKSIFFKMNRFRYNSTHDEIYRVNKIDSRSEYNLSFITDERAVRHNRCLHDMGTKPRLAIINSDYENIGSENLGLSMWDKTYKQCEQMFSLKISGGICDLVKTYNDKLNIMFCMRGQITQK